MKRISFFIITFSLLTNSVLAQSTTKDKHMQWWRDARFGMFIHWGVYAVPGGVYNGHPMTKGGAEWIMNRSKISVAEYQQYAKQFNPVKYDADAWVKMAKDAGMKYIVITAKHHDGFALFKSNASKWNMADATPYGKDILKPLAAACKKYGIKLGFYYSHAQDWNNPGGSAARKVATEGWPNPDSAKIDAYTEAHTGHWDPAQTTRSMADYIDQVSVPQVKELLTNYGDVAVLWWDTPTNMTDEFAAKLNDVLKLQPNIITNDRLKRANYFGDYKTPEQKIPDESELDGKDWETCMTMNGSWGYKSFDHNWKSDEKLIRNLVDIASKGGNYLLNVGPQADGAFPDEAIKSLKAIGKWMNVNSQAIYGTKASPLEALSWGRCTKKDVNGNTTLYVSVFNWPKDGKLTIPGVKTPINSIKLLAGNMAVNAKQTGDVLELQLPAKAPDEIASVIKIDLKGLLQKGSAKTGKIKSGELD